MPKKRKLVILSLSDLEKKETKKFLGYLKRLQQCEDSFESSDLDDNPDLTNNYIIYFKQTEKWKNAYLKVKFILKNKELI